ncbi:MAG TPA: sialate O-acetylesterase [Polyangiaceae bacterium]
MMRQLLAPVMLAVTGATSFAGCIVEIAPEHRPGWAGRSSYTAGSANAGKGGTGDSGGPEAGGAGDDAGGSAGEISSGGGTMNAGDAGAGGGEDAAGGEPQAGGAPPSGDGGAPAGQGNDAGEGGAGERGGTSSSGGSSGTAGAAGMSGTAGTGPTVPTFHVFLLLGQSNMAGYPQAQAADRTENPRIRVLGFDSCSSTGRQTDVWDTAAPPLHNCWSNAIGPGDYFAKALVDLIHEGDTIGLVPCAINGERIETFLKVGGTQYDYIVRRARLAQDAGGVIQGILFHQGESNAGDSSWPGKVNTLVTDLRTDLALGNVPFLAGELAPLGSSAGHNTQVNRLPGIVTNSYVVSAQGLTVDPADTTYNVHFGHDSQVEFGRRFAATMIDALNW